MENVERAAERIDRPEGDEPDYQDLYLRTLAEFDNFRKRTERDRRELGEAGKRDLLLALLDVVDNFERASAAAPPTSEEAAAVVAGYDAIYRQLQRLLESHGVHRFESLGEPFDPERHEAIATVPASGEEDGRVVDESRAGYLWNNRLLRPARVVIGRDASV
jgi:molecular chaperone GrpE